MAKIDDIFKSDLSENEKFAKSLFGKMLIKLRKENYMRLYSLMSSVSSTKINDDKLILIFSDKSAYEIVESKTDYDTLNLIIRNIDERFVLKLELQEKKVFDEYKFEEFLRQEFGRILTIK